MHGGRPATGCFHLSDEFEHQLWTSIHVISERADWLLMGEINPGPEIVQRSQNPQTLSNVRVMALTAKPMIRQLLMNQLLRIQQPNCCCSFLSWTFRNFTRKKTKQFQLLKFLIFSPQTGASSINVSSRHTQTGVFQGLNAQMYPSSGQTQSLIRFPELLGHASTDVIGIFTAWPHTSFYF